MRLGNCLFALICSLITAGLASAQSANEVTPNRTAQRQDAVSLILKNPFEQAQLPFDADESDSPFIQGKVRHLTLRHTIAGATTESHDVRAENEKSGPRNAKSMPMFESSFTLLGATFPFRMIGTDPAEGSQSTTIPVTIVPLQLSFPDGSQLSASQIACGDTQSAAARVMQSPLFNSFPFTVGGTFVGNTQFMDAFRRANFWTDVTTRSPDYHVLLSPTLAPTVAIVPNPGFAQTAHGPCAEIATVDIGDFDFRIQALIAAMNIPPDTLPVFITYNTFLTQNGGCCILGYHSTTFNARAHPYAVAAYEDPGIFFHRPIQDINSLSHELGEWLDDPTTRNFIPAWGNVGQVGGCSFSLETGDPVTGTAFEAPLNGFTYHPEDLVFLPWFARQVPSTSVNGQFTFLDGLTAPQKVCQR